MILIKGGRLVLPEGIMEADLLIEGEKIAKIGKPLSPKKAQVINASGRLVFPGAIDAHVHFRDPEDTTKEDFSTGSASALAGGVTTVIDMPNYRNPPTTTIAAYNQKRIIAATKARCDYQLRFGGSEKNAEEAARSGAPSLKIFLSETRSELTVSHSAAVQHFATFPAHKPVCVHAEDKERIENRRKRFKLQSEIQDKLSAQLACEFSLREAAKLNRRVHICHLTTGLEIEMCRRYKNATYEITPSHLFLSTADLKRLGQLGRINPPLRDKAEQAALWRNLGKDTIIASDHAPHLITHKLDGAPGFPGVGTIFPLLLDAASKRRIRACDIARWCAENPAGAFYLKNKGRLAEGFDADLVIVNMKKKWKITAENRLSKCGWTPFEGKEIVGKIEKVFLRGKLAFDGEIVLSKPGMGRELL
ncbi:MAG: dihydroorotase [Candidatus Micrarchaeota archaeon]|nr:dihydroorotase [Candidatus Micrarchaeota archaeon]